MQSTYMAWREAENRRVLDEAARMVRKAARLRAERRAEERGARIIRTAFNPNRPLSRAFQRQATAA